MDRHVRFEPLVRSALGACGLTRRGIVRVFAITYDELEHRADSHRGPRDPRDPRDPDRFLYALPLLDGGRWHLFLFGVNDAQAQGYLLVEKVDHTAAPGPS